VLTAGQIVYAGEYCCSYVKWLSSSPQEDSPHARDTSGGTDVLHICL